MSTPSCGPMTPMYAARYLRPRRLALIRLAALELVRVRPGADHRDVRGVLAAPRDGDLPVGLVGGDHVVGACGACGAQGTAAPCTAASGRRSGTRTARGTGHGGRTRTWSAPAALNAMASGQKMSGGLHAWMTANRPRARRRGPGVEGLPGRGGERVRVLGDEAQLAAAGRVGLVLVQLNAVDDLIARVVLALGADHGDLVAGRGEGLALQPHPPVKRHRKVLDDDQDAPLHAHMSIDDRFLILRLACITAQQPRIVMFAPAGEFRRKRLGEDDTRYGRGSSGRCPNGSRLRCHGARYGWSLAASAGVSRTRLWAA